MAVVEQRLQIEGVLEISPSLRAWPDAVLAKAYRLGRVRAAEETGLSEGSFPETCPYSLEQIMNDGFYPGQSEPEVV